MIVIYGNENIVMLCEIMKYESKKMKENNNISIVIMKIIMKKPKWRNILMKNNEKIF